MSLARINEQTVEGINAGKESAFATLYDSYYSYLCVFATTYIFNADEAKEIVNDVFMNVWNSRGRLSFPIHNYLLRSVQNRCLNHIRTLHTRERVLDEYREELLAFQEEFCANDDDPLQLLEIEELKRQVGTVRSIEPSGDSCDERMRGPSRMSLRVMGRDVRSVDKASFRGVALTTATRGSAHLREAKSTSMRWAPTASGVSSFTSLPSTSTFEASTPVTAKAALAWPEAVMRNVSDPTLAPGSESTRRAVMSVASASVRRGDVSRLLSSKPLPAASVSPSVGGRAMLTGPPTMARVTRMVSAGAEAMTGRPMRSAAAEMMRVFSMSG